MAIRVTVLILVVIALVYLVILSGRQNSEALHRLEWRFTAVAGVLAGVLLAKLLLGPTGISETTSSSVDVQGHTHTVTHSTATYLLQPGAGGIILGIVVALAALLVIAAILSLAYRDWRSEQSGNVPLLWVIAVGLQGATIVTGFSIGFWFLAVPPLLMLGALAGALAGTRSNGSDPSGFSTTPA